MIDIRCQKIFVPKECIKNFLIYWNGDMVIHVSDPTKGNHKDEFKKWINLCGLYDKQLIDDLIQIGNHIFDENRFEFSCSDITPMIPNKAEGNIQIVLSPKKGKKEALEMKIENLIIPREFIRVVKFRENRTIQIRTEQPDLENESHEKLKELIAISGVIEKKQIIDEIKIGNHIIKQRFRFGCKPKLGVVGVSKGTFEILLDVVNN